ncbi:MAG: hypothetical protein ACR2NG_09735 [Acidimicrobiia bacterium]
MATAHPGSDIPEIGTRPEGSISTALVLAQLDRIASSPSFVGAPQLTRFLQYVVEEAVAGRGSELNQYKVAVEALGQDDGFDPVVDTMVRTYANRLRRALDSYYEGPGRSDTVVVKIPRGTYKPVFADRGDGATGTGGAEWEERANSGFNGDTSVLTPTIALLPLRDFSVSEHDTYVAEGLTEELAHLLSRFSDFSVIGPLSRERLHSDGLGPHEIGSRYDARFVLDGSANINQNRLLVKARLLDTGTGAIVWADRYDRPLDQAALPDVLTDIGHSVLGATVDVHGPASRVLSSDIAELSTHTVVDQQAMLMFHAYLRHMTPDRHAATKRALEHVQAREPFAAQIAAALGGMYVTDYTHYGASRDAAQRGLALTESSIRLDPDDHFVQFEAAYVYFYTKDVDDFRRMAELSVLSNPRTSNHGDTALFFALAGDPGRAMELFAIGRKANPHHPDQFHLAPFFSHAYDGDFEAALDSANRINMPGYFLGPLVQASALGHLGRLDEAKPAKAELLSLLPQFEVQARDILERLFRYDEPIDLVLDGLAKSGLDV